MKKLIALLLTALLLPLTACGDTGTGTQVRAPQKQEENTLQNQEVQNMVNMKIDSALPAMLAAAVYPKMPAYPVESEYYHADGSFDGEAFNTDQTLDSCYYDGILTKIDRLHMQ